MYYCSRLTALAAHSAALGVQDLSADFQVSSPDGASLSDVNKDLTFKAKDKDKDQTLKAKDQDKDQTPKDKNKDKDQTFKAKDQDKD